MKLSYSCLLALAGCLALTAADMSMDQGTLDADTFSGDLGEGQKLYNFQGHVQFRYPGMLDLDCSDLTIRLFPGGDKIDRLIASNDVVMTLIQRSSTNSTLPLNRGGGTNRIHAALAEYTSTNDTVTLTGSPSFGQPWVEGAEGSFRADVITFDRIRDKITARGNFRMIIRPDALPKGSLNPVHPTPPPSR